MFRSVNVAALALILGGCGHDPVSAQCPDPAAVAPPSIGAAYVAGLSARLAGPDRENSIVEAIADIHRRDPGLGSTTVTNILLAADCPVAAARPDHTAAEERARISRFRAQVDQLLGE